MKADAIIFDKDGTLIDFDAFWVTVSVKAIEDILNKLGRTDIPACDILTAFGVNDGVTDIEGVLCKGTYEQMGQIVHSILKGHGCNIPLDEAVKLVIDAYNKNADAGQVKPTCPELKEVLTKLKNQNKRLAVVTTDNDKITRKCLKRLGIEELFDKIYTDSGDLPTKPDPCCALDFADHTGVEKERLIVVGDTVTDVSFARNAGIKVISIAKTDKHRAALTPFADKVISSLTELSDILE